MSKERPGPVGIIDVGTNAVHLLIAGLGQAGRFRILGSAHDLVRLGEGGFARGVLPAAGMRRAEAALRRYASLMRRHQVNHIEAVATSAVRDARNGSTFLRRIRARLGIPLRCISARHEARLIYAGARQANRLRGKTLMIAVGGGSAQVMVGDGPALRYAASVTLGATRLAERFIRHDPPRPAEVTRLEAHVRRAWAPVARAARRRRWSQALGSSAMIGHLARAIAAHSARRRPAASLSATISRSKLRRLVQWLSASTASQRRCALAGVDSGRRHLLLAAGMVLLGWMELCGVSTLRCVPGSLREGLIAEWLARRAS